MARTETGVSCGYIRSRRTAVMMQLYEAGKPDEAAKWRADQKAGPSSLSRGRPTSPGPVRRVTVSCSSGHACYLAPSSVPLSPYRVFTNPPTLRDAHTHPGPHPGLSCAADAPLVSSTADASQPAGPSPSDRP